MKEKCLNCGKITPVGTLEYDVDNLDNFHVICVECGASFDIDFPVNKTFVLDIAKMADFKKLSKEEFLQTYSYLTEEEYEVTKLYLDWLKN